MAQQNKSHPLNSGPQDWIEFWVDGIPRPQGSKKLVRGGRMVEASRHVKQWRDIISARAMVEGPKQPIEGAVGLAVHFFFERPKSHFRTGKNSHLLRKGAPQFPTTRSVGDNDKLLRAVCDGLSVTSGGSCILDDSAVVWIYGQKDWTDDKAGCMIRIFEL